jgi:hypothetical protein
MNADGQLYHKTEISKGAEYSGLPSHSGTIDPVLAASYLS